MQGNRHQAQFNLVGTAAIVLFGAALFGACNREETDTVASTTTAADVSERRGDEPRELSRVGEIQRSKQPRPATTPTTVKTPGTLSERQDPIVARGHACPMVIHDAKVEVEDTVKGVAMRFTTASGDVDDLRDRVEQLSRLYAAGERRGLMEWHHMGPAHHGRGGHHGGMGPESERVIPAVTAEVENIDDGARLELTPSDSSEIDDLRRLVRDHQRRLDAGECWMARERGGQGEGSAGEGTGQPVDRS